MLAVPKGDLEGFHVPLLRATAMTVFKEPRSMPTTDMTAEKRGEVAVPERRYDTNGRGTRQGGERARPWWFMNRGCKRFWRYLSSDFSFGNKF